MKRIFLILVMVGMVGLSSAIQPPRKPFIQITIDGKSYNSGDILTVTPGQKMMIAVEMEGGRRDYCKFPETYADITSTAQILSRGSNGISYLLDDKKNEWKLLGEEALFTSEDFLQINVRPDRMSAEVTVSTEKFPQTYLKISTTTKWQFNQNGSLSEETNRAEGTIYIQMAGQSDVWFKSANIEASGIRNDLVRDKLNEVQASCDSIEKNFYRLNFNAVQQSIRSLQTAVGTLKTTIDHVKAANQSYQTQVLFIGIPSDHPYEAIDVIAVVKKSWIEFEPVMGGLKQQLAKLPAQSTRENKDQLINIINNYIDWQNKLPKNAFQIMPLFMPRLKQDEIKLPDNLNFTPQGKSMDNYPQAISDFNAFLDKRIQQIPDEIDKINAIHTQLQAIRLFDQMLRSYFSSINWAEWKSTRGF